MRHLRSSTTLVFTLGLAAASARLEAQHAPPPSQTPSVDERIEVVATRLPEAPHDVPASIEVIDGEMLRALGATTLREALSMAAGVAVAPGGDAGPAGAVPEFWGLREFDAFLLVVDDIPWGGAFNPALTTVDLRDVERIEVLRGPAPVTYGATSFVGVIHVVHRPASATTSYLSSSAGTFKTGSAAVDLELPAAGAWTSRLNMDVERRGFKDRRTSFARGHTTYRGSRSVNDARVWLTADVNWLAQQPASPHPREGPSLAAATPLDANYNPAGAFADDTRVSVAFGTEHPVAREVRWSTTASYSHSAQRQFRGFLTDLADVARNATGFRENIDINDLYGDTHLIWTGRPRLQFLVGGDVLFGNGEGRGATFQYTAPLEAVAAPAVSEPATLDLDAESRRTFVGGYASAEWTPAARLHLSGGLRLNATVERRGEGASATHVRPAGSLGALVGLWQRGADHVKLFADYRDTFKPAAFDFSLAENEGVLEPETARSYEGGVKARAAGGRLDVEAAGFRMDFHNLVTATVSDGLPLLQNSGVSRFQGFEAAAEGHGPRGISARFSYSFHDGRFLDFVQTFDDVNVQLGGHRIEMSARHLFSAGLVVAPGRGLTGHAVVTFTGDRYLDKRNRALAPGFATLDAGAGYRRDRWELRVDARNLTDRRAPGSESELGDAQYYLLPARRIDATLGVRF